MTSAAVHPRGGAATRTVLVVDDMEANRAVLGRRLEKLDYAVTCVESGMAALAMLERWQPDIVLLDYMMPQMNGIEVLRELRANAATRDLPIVMVTARAESEAIVEALAAGADDYVTKPIDFEVLQARIEIQLSKRSDARHLQRANAALDERVTVRSMVVADLEGELQAEIRRRQDLERKLAATAPEPHPPVPPPSISPPHATRADPSADRRSTPGLQPLLEDISARFENVFAAAIFGKAANLAQLAELRSLLARARSEAGT